MAGFLIGQDDTRVAAIVFSDQAELVFPLNAYNSLSELQEAILGITQMRPDTPNTPEAFRVAGTQCFNAANGDRDDVDNVIIIATEGIPYPTGRRNSATTEAMKLRDKGVRIAFVGFGNNVDRGFLSDISSKDSYFKATDFSEVDEIKASLLDQLCLSLEEGELILHLLS